MARTTLRKTLRSRGHKALITILVAARKKAGMTQRIWRRESAAAFFRGRMEAGERRVDVMSLSRSRGRWRGNLRSCLRSWWNSALSAQRTRPNVRTLDDTCGSMAPRSRPLLTSPCR